MSTVQTQSTQTGGKISLPSSQTLEQAAKLAIKLSKPMCFYFYIEYPLFLFQGFPISGGFARGSFILYFYLGAELGSFPIFLSL